MSQQRVSLEQFIRDLSQASNRLRSGLKSAMYYHSTSLITDLKKRSPVDDDIFRQNWRISRFSVGTDGLPSVSIVNRTPYAGWLDEGAEERGAPWYWPTPSNPGPISNSGKLIIRSGRVWAGGKSESGFVIGGISDVILMKNWKRQLSIAKSFAEAVLGAI